MDVDGEEDGGWAGLAGCPYGVQGNNRGGRVEERPHHQRLARCAVQLLFRISQHAYASTGGQVTSRFTCVQCCFPHIERCVYTSIHTGIKLGEEGG